MFRKTAQTLFRNTRSFTKFSSGRRVFKTSAFVALAIGISCGATYYYTQNKKSTFIQPAHCKESNTQFSSFETPVRVCIIGSGVGGSATARFVRDLLKDDVDIVIFEKNDKIGGRTGHVRSLVNLN